MKLALHWKILIGLALGVAVGLACNLWGPSLRDATGPSMSGVIDFIINLNQLIGDLFKRSLQFIAVPIILFAMILAISSLGDLKKLGRIGGKTVGIFACTAFLSVGVGLTLVNVIQPGGPRFIGEEARAKLLASTQSETAGKLVATSKSVKPWDLVREIVPTNPFDALSRGDMLQVVVFALLLGIALSLLPRERSEPVFKVVEGLNEAFIMIVRGIMHVAPLGVFCLVTPIVGNLGFDVLASLGAYCMTVLLGLLIIQFLIYPRGGQDFLPHPHPHLLPRHCTGADGGLQQFKFRGDTSRNDPERSRSIGSTRGYHELCVCDGREDQYGWNSADAGGGDCLPGAVLLDRIDNNAAGLNRVHCSVLGYRQPGYSIRRHGHAGHRAQVGRRARRWNRDDSGSR